MTNQMLVVVVNGDDDGSYNDGDSGDDDGSYNDVDSDGDNSVDCDDV